MRGIHILWTTLAALGTIETFRLLLAAARTCRLTRAAHSRDPRYLELACHDLWTERVRLAKQLLVLAGVCLSFVPLAEPYRVESRNLVFVLIGLLLLVNSERDLWLRRQARREGA